MQSGVFEKNSIPDFFDRDQSRVSGGAYLLAVFYA
jgi:hypothetical protein